LGPNPKQLHRSLSGIESNPFFVAASSTTLHCHNVHPWLLSPTKNLIGFAPQRAPVRPSAPQCAQNSRGFKNRAKTGVNLLKTSGLSAW
ncbi:MAG TPA: hypothetical protein PKM73_18040, partial [Verrucomicrobiota bacterium]|nr:hypothetical protein [Verrucomicrobiota bacterium]HNU53104.1 hypothetical protein [Verrucomicrobiota bacterium]